MQTAQTSRVQIRGTASFSPLSCRSRPCPPHSQTTRLHPTLQQLPLAQLHHQPCPTMHLPLFPAQHQLRLQFPHPHRRPILKSPNAISTIPSVLSTVRTQLSNSLAATELVIITPAPCRFRSNTSTPNSSPFALPVRATSAD